MRNKYKIQFILISIFIFTVFSILLFTQALDYIDNYFTDILYQNEQAPIDGVVIISVDDESLDVLGKWPWPRSHHGKLLSILDQGGARAVGLDLLLVEEGKEDDDNNFINSLKKLKTKPIFASYGVFDEESGEGILKAIDFYKPYEKFEQYVDFAHINTIPDADGIIRRTITYIQYEDLMIPSMARAMVEKSKKRELRIPMDDWGRTYIRYSGKAGSVEQIPYYMVLNGEVDGEYFRDKLVLIGVTSIGLADDYYFPSIDRAYPMYGVEVHANIVRQMIDGRYWKVVPRLIEVLILIALSLISSWVFYRKKAGFNVLFFIFISFAYVLISYLLSSMKQGYLLRITYTILSIFTIFIAINLVRYVIEVIERKRVTNLFGKYVEPKVVEKLLEGSEREIALGGSKKFITVLFVDIRGFTTMSEVLEPEEVVNILNEYLELCARAIFKFDGTLDKFIGDAAMAIYGAPLDLEEHALKAIKTAIYMKEESEQLAKNLEEKFGRSVSFGIGINTGYAIVGNIGSKIRLDYTAIGDTVNTAARLESNAKPGEILISRETYELVKEKVKVGEVREMKVKGKVKVLEVFELKSIL